jgi:hypothetical protein
MQTAASPLAARCISAPSGTRAIRACSAALTSLTAWPYLMVFN